MTSYRAVPVTYELLLTLGIMTGFIIRDKPSEKSDILLWIKPKYSSKAPDLLPKIYFSKLLSTQTIQWAFLMISATDGKPRITHKYVYWYSYTKISGMASLETSKSLGSILLSLVWSMKLSVLLNNNYFN